MRVALAEDDHDLRHALAETLRDAGIEVVEAASGNQLLAIVRSTRVELVVTDLMMPGLRGDDVLKLFRAAGDRTPYLVITAAPDWVVDGLAGEDRVTILRKPFTVDAVLAAVTRALASDAGAP
jgi:DNA-binding response OmpR family regulator